MDMVGALDVHREQVPSIGWTGRTVGVGSGRQMGRVGFRRWLAQFDGEQSSWRSKPSTVGPPASFYDMAQANLDRHAALRQLLGAVCSTIVSARRGACSYWRAPYRASA